MWHFILLLWKIWYKIFSTSNDKTVCERLTSAYIQQKTDELYYDENEQIKNISLRNTSWLLSKKCLKYLIWFPSILVEKSRIFFFYLNKNTQHNSTIIPNVKITHQRLQQIYKNTISRNYSLKTIFFKNNENSNITKLCIIIKPTQC